MDEKTIIGIAGALLGAVTTYLVAVLKLRRELEYKYDTDLRDKRIPQYLELWKLLEDLAKYARPKQLIFDDLHKLSASLRQWYFERGGLYLSEKSRDRYFALQDAIKKVLDVKGQSVGATVGEETYENLRMSGSDLRTALTRDVGTRKSPKLN
jgi:hypothetical protein